MSSGFFNFQSMNPKSIYFITLTLLLSPALSSQVADLASHRVLQDSIVAKYNRNDFKSIYQLASPSFKKLVSESYFIDFLKKVNQSGAVMSSELSEDLGELKVFKWTMPKSFLELNISASSKKEFNVFSITVLSPYDTAYVKSIPTDNPLKDTFDIAIDKTVRKYFRNKNAAGLSLGVIKGKKITVYNYGESKKGSRQLPTANTYYEIGSITKTFTGTILAEAVLENKLRLNDDIRKFLKGSYDNLQYQGQPIQVVHLSNHTSGLPGLPGDFFNQVPYDAMNPYRNYNAQKFWNALRLIKLDNLPGTNQSYSNYGVSLLGFILENVYKIDYETLVRKFITNPLKMWDTKLSLNNTEMKRFAEGTNKYGKPTSHWDIGPFSAAGGLRSTINDMMKYLQYQIAEKNKAVLLSHQLTRGSYEDGNGLNWFIAKTLSGIKKYHHDGGTGGFRTMIMVLPELKSGYVLLTNSEIEISSLTRELTYRLTK